MDSRYSQAGELNGAAWPRQRSREVTYRARAESSCEAQALHVTRELGATPPVGERCRANRPTLDSGGEPRGERRSGVGSETRKPPTGAQTKSRAVWVSVICFVRSETDGSAMESPRGDFHLAEALFPHCVAPVARHDDAPHFAVSDSASALRALARSSSSSSDAERGTPAFSGEV
jgi:hypothetical protein